MIVFLMLYNILQNDWITDFCVFFQFLVYFTSKISELKALHYCVQTRQWKRESGAWKCAK